MLTSLHIGTKAGSTPSPFIKHLALAAQQAGLKPLQKHGICIGTTLFYLLMGMPIKASVVAALSWCFAILVNKFCEIMKIFERLDHLRNRWVLCQH
jgi:hypothetical protein